MNRSEADTSGEASRPPLDLRPHDSAAADINPIVRAIADTTSDTVMVLDRDARIRFINRLVPDLTAEQVLGKAAHLFVPADYHGMMIDCFERVARTREPAQHEVAYVAQRGDITYWSMWITPIVRGDDVDGFVLVGRNVTELRKEAFERDRFFSMSVDMLCVVAADGRFERVNPAFERTLGYSSQELLAMSVLDLAHPDDRERAVESARHLRADQTAFEFENRIRHKDGEYRWLSWRAAADPSGQRIHAIARDITDRKLLEAQLQHSQKLDAIGQLAGGVAHDFNNLLLAIRINTEAASARPDDTTRLQQHLEQIRQAALRAGDLTRQLLTFARHQPLDARVLDVRELSEQLHALVRRLIPESIEIVLHSGDEPCLVEADPAQLEQVLLNLCVNARDAMPAGGVLRIDLEPVRLDHRFCAMHSWAKPGRYIALHVSDSGIGMTPEVQTRLFEPFFTTKPHGSGTGLGLSTVYGIVRRHGGLLHVESAPGQGSRFAVYLPQHCASRTVFVEHTTDDDTPEGGSETLLIAEDDALVRSAVVNLLEYVGYNVIVARDGAEAVDLYRRYEHDIDLLMLDITMPRVSGPQALEEIRKLNPNVRAIFTSGYATPSQLPSSPAVLPKPYEPNALLRRVRAELDRIG